MHDYFNNLLEKEGYLSEVKSGKTYAKCKHHYRFNCNWIMRKFEVKGTGEYKVEIAGQHDHNGDENFAVGLPQNYKDTADLALSLYVHHTPAIVKGIIKNKYNTTLSKKEFMQLQSYIQRKRNKLKDTY